MLPIVDGVEVDDVEFEVDVDDDGGGGRTGGYDASHTRRECHVIQSANKQGREKPGADTATVTEVMVPKAILDSDPLISKPKPKEIRLVIVRSQ